MVRALAAAGKRAAKGQGALEVCGGWQGGEGSVLGWGGGRAQGVLVEARALVRKRVPKEGFAVVGGTVFFGEVGGEDGRCSGSSEG